MQRKNVGQMRLNREAKMVKRDIEAQIKKTGKITDNFICLPDPEDVYTWYYIIFGLDTKEFQGGFYMGKVKCPEDYPAKAPQINMLTENGRFSLQKDGICLSISSFHPESWNPAWKVNQIVIGLTMFWLGGEGTYGSVHEHDYPRDVPFSETRMGLAIKSREQVMKHEKFSLFEPYAAAIGIDKEQEFPEWIPIKAKFAKIEAEKEAKRLAAEEKKRQIEEQKKIEAELAERKLKEKVIQDYFKLLMQKDLTKYVGQPEHAKKAIRKIQA